jgi:S-adenosylmethionine synthetase
MKKNFLFTSESVTDGHPDRLCDSISDAVVDRFLQKDPYARIIAECALSKNVLFLAARFVSEITIDIPEVARSVLTRVGYHPDDFDAQNCSVLTSLIRMSSEHRAFADENDLSEAELDQITAHSQATVFGFACNQTPELMPLPIVLSNRMAHRLSVARMGRKIAGLSPDCTVQVSVRYENGVPVHIPGITIIAGTSSAVQLDSLSLRELLISQVIKPMFDHENIGIDKETEIFVNPQGAYPKSGPAFHSGMTGRKTAADTYGAYARHSGSALSGKDPSRIDRIGAYMSRYVAKNVVAAGLAEDCEVQLSYSIGHPVPTSIQVNTFETGKIGEDELLNRINKTFDFRIGSIIRDFNLRHLPGKSTNGFYQNLPVEGHFGNTSTALPWEKIDRAETLRK